VKKRLDFSEGVTIKCHVFLYDMSRIIYLRWNVKTVLLALLFPS